MASSKRMTLGKNRKGDEIVQVNFRCPHDIFAIFENASVEAGLSFSQWLIHVGLTRAGQYELLTQLQRAAAHGQKQRHRR